MEDFDVVYEKDKVFGDHLICRHCGERVECGIVTVAHHWMYCLKRTAGLVITETNLDNWSINS